MWVVVSLFFQSVFATDAYCEWSARLPAAEDHLAYCIQSPSGSLRSPNLLQHILTTTKVHLIQATFRRREEGILFFPNSTYAEGRNALLFEACRQELQQGFRFGYLAFVDDDVEIVAGSLRAWHAVLLQWEPAVMVPAESFVLDADSYAGRPAGVWMYDSFFIAYRREVADALLPLRTSLDDAKECWWSSSFYVQHMTGVYLQGHCLLSDRLVVRNSKAGSYPRKGCNSSNMRRVWEVSLNSHSDTTVLRETFHRFAEPYLEWGRARVLAAVANMSIQPNYLQQTIT